MFLRIAAVLVCIPASTSLFATALHKAARKGDIPIIRQMIVNGTSVDRRDSNGNTALYSAVLNRQHSAAHLLLELGADPNARSPRKYHVPPLYYAARSGDYASAVLLIRYGAHIHARDNHGRSILAAAAGGRLLDENSLPGRLAIAKLLLARGVAVDEAKGAALASAVSWGEADMVRLLLHKGADCRRNSQFGWTLLHSATKDREKVSLLLEKGLDPNAVNARGNTPLHHAAINGWVESAALLLAAGADPAIRNVQGRTALDTARRSLQREKKCQRRAGLERTIMLLRQYHRQ